MAPRSALVLARSWPGPLTALVLALGPLAAERTPSEDELSGPRVEHFILELPGADGPRPIGSLAWIARGAAGALELEWDVDFPRDHLRLLVLERLGPAGAGLVWRELTDPARSLTVEWAPQSGELVLREWAREGTLRETRTSAQGAVLPLYLLEMARAGDLVQGRFQVFEATARALVGMELSTSYGKPDVPGEWATPCPPPIAAERRVELRREDGTLAGRYRFQGDELIGFEWQEGGVRGRRVERAVFEAARSVARHSGTHPGTDAPGAPGLRAGRHPAETLGRVGTGGPGSVRER